MAEEAVMPDIDVDVTGIDIDSVLVEEEAGDFSVQLAGLTVVMTFDQALKLHKALHQWFADDE